MTPREIVKENRNRLICEMAENGSTIYQIGEYFKISPQRAAQILRRAKVQTTRAARYGETKKIGTNIERERLDQFTQTRKAHKMGLAEAVEEALKLFVQKYGG